MIPDDDPSRSLTVASPDDPGTTYISLVGNAPHHFRNASGAPARMLCMCTPAGQDEYFMRVGDVVAGWDAPPPRLSADELAERRRRAVELAPAYRSEFL